MDAHADIEAALLVAAEAGDLARVQSLLHSTLSVISEDERRPAACAAAKRGNVDIVACLLDFSSRRIAWLQTVTLLSAYEGGFLRDIVERLLTNGGFEIWECINTAVFGPRVGLIKPLLAFVPATASDSKRVSFLKADAILRAAMHGELEAIDALLSSPAIDPTVWHNQPLRSASRAGYVHCVLRLLRDPRVNPADRDSHALRAAAAWGHLPVVDSLLADGRADPAARSHAALRQAACRQRWSVVERLLADPRVDPTAGHCAALRACARHGQLPLLERLLADPRVDPSALNNSAVWEAARHGRSAVVELLVADPRVNPAANDHAALRIAARYGHDEVVARLLADPRVSPAARSQAALRDAAARGRSAVVDRLLADARVDPAVRRGAALRAAAAAGHLAVVERLLAHPRVNPAVHDSGALCAAAANGRLAVVERLLADARVDPAANRCNPLRAASALGHVAVVQRLLADPRVPASPYASNAITDAASRGQLAVLDVLLRDDRLDLLAVVAHAALAAMTAGHAAAVERLLADARVEPDLIGGPVLLVDAAEAGHAGIVARLLGHSRFDISKPHKDEPQPLSRWSNNHYSKVPCGIVALVTSTRAGHAAVVQSLLSDGRVDPVRFHECMLQLPATAAAEGNLEIVQLLFADPRLDVAAEGQAALYAAAAEGHLHVVDALLADPRIDANFPPPCKAGCTHDLICWSLAGYYSSSRTEPAIAAAARGGHIAVVERLLADGRSNPAAGCHMALRAALRSYPEELQRRSRTLTEHATVIDHDAVALRLLEDPRVDPSVGQSEVEQPQQRPLLVSRVQAQPALPLAVPNRSFAVIKRLLQDSRVNPATDGNAAIVHAAQRGDPEILRLLLSDARVDPSANKSAALRVAAEKVDAVTVLALLADPRVSPDAATAEGAFLGTRQEWGNGFTRLFPVPFEEAEATFQQHGDAVSDPGALHKAFASCVDSVQPGGRRFAELSTAKKEEAVARCMFAMVPQAAEDVGDDPLTVAAVLETLRECGGPDSDFALRRLHLRMRAPRIEDGHERLLLRYQRGHATGVDERHTAGGSALAMAAYKGHLPVVEALLADARTDPSAHKQMAIRWAARGGHVAVVERLLADLRVNPSAGHNDAIFLAARHCRLPVVERLLADPRVLAGPLHATAAIMCRCPGSELLLDRLLTEHGVLASAYENAALHIACSAGNAAVVRRLLREPWVARSSAWNHALTAAARGSGSHDFNGLPVIVQPDYAGVVDALLAERPAQAGGRSDYGIDDAVQAAASAGRIALAQRLLREPLGAEAKKHALRAALTSGCLPLVRQLLADPEVDVAGDGYELLIAGATCRSGKLTVPVLERLLSDARIDVAAHGPAALVVAVQEWRCEAVQWLLADSRVDATAFDNAAIRLAADARREAYVKVLLAHPGVDPSARAHEALWLAARKGDGIGTVRLLLRDARVHPAANCGASAGGHTAAGAPAANGAPAPAAAERAAPQAAPAAAVPDAAGAPALEAGAQPAAAAVDGADAAGDDNSDSDADEPDRRRVPAGAGRHCPTSAAAYSGDLSSLQLLLSDARVVHACCFNDAIVAAAQGIDRCRGRDREFATETQAAVVAHLLENSPVSADACSRALLAACRRKHVAAASKLLADTLRRADPLACNSAGCDALDLALANYDAPRGAREPDLGLPSRIDRRHSWVDFRAGDGDSDDDALPPPGRAEAAAREAASAKRETALLLALEPAVLHSRLQRPDWHQRLRELDLPVESLAGRAWMRRRHVVAARVRALEGEDSE